MTDLKLLALDGEDATRVGTLVVAALWFRLFPALARRDRML